eukprot:6896378-Alexandrium_andersonii.AAC.1
MAGLGDRIAIDSGLLRTSLSLSLSRSLARWHTLHAASEPLRAWARAPSPARPRAQATRHAG